MLKYDRLDAALKAALPVADISCGWGPARDEPNCTYYTRVEGVVRVHWTSGPTPQQDMQAAAIVAGFDPSPTETERLDSLSLPPRVQGALVVLAASSSTAGEKAKARAIIDAAYQQVKAQLS